MEEMEEIRFNNGVVEIYVNGNLVSHATISFIRATYGEDREELAGIVRMTDLDIEYDRRDFDNFDYESDVHTKLWDDLCVIEYNTMDDDNEEPDSSTPALTWRDEAKNDIASYTGVSEDCIEIATMTA